MSMSQPVDPWKVIETYAKDSNQHDLTTQGFGFLVLHRVCNALVELRGRVAALENLADLKTRVDKLEKEANLTTRV